MGNTQFKHELGIEAKDTVTGFRGIIIGRAQHLTGCNTYGLKPLVDKEGKILEDQWFDETRIDIIKSGRVIKLITEDNLALAGGPQEYPKKTH